LESLYPTSPEDIDPWRRRHGVTAEEARKRFMQYVVLESIPADPGLAGSIIFKGGNALRFVYGNRRSTIDLDFTARGAFPDDEKQIRVRLDEALRFALSRFRVKARCQRVKRNPRDPAKTTPTYDISVGYLLPTDRQYQNFDELPSVVTTIDI
jgi:predicted nucleotidyltransferase component of viral defense system